MRAGRRALLLGLVLVGAGWSPAVGLAQDDGVTVDPDSPAGKEYALPLDRARGDAGGGSQGSASAAPSGTPGASATPQSTFGEGITSPSRRDKRDARRDASPTRQGGKASPTPAPTASSVAVREANADTGGPGSGLALVVGGALVVLIGGAVGLGMRRRRD